MKEEIEKNIKNMTLNENPKRKFKFIPELKEFLIKSKIADIEKKYYLPTPENLDFLFKLNI